MASRAKEGWDGLGSLSDTSLFSLVFELRWLPTAFVKLIIKYRSSEYLVPPNFT